ncbi:hypothetical protein [Flagellimonas pacifica]|uniref:Uncharacterized protein n=1 Tax=Flagellimonas pacifica TaxID=1247520 RepID=A0A285MFE6_9FLAO|nr:hypothetical protein [Allomuricauda parva]SNY95453.1 hypothetical protein SAMN06265377_1122 [Allomuricauda parva]
MHLLIIIWTLICASVIMGYPIYLLNKSHLTIEASKKNSPLLASNTVELLSFDLSNQLPGWSFSLDVPEITEEVLLNNPILFYLESDDSCLKLPLDNSSLGYSANVYKNTGKVYVTFKSLADQVSNFYVPSWHLNKLKILIIKSKDKRLYGDWNTITDKSSIYKALRKAKVNIEDYEDILGYFSNIASIDFKGHIKAPKPGKQMRSSSYKLAATNKMNHELCSTG